MLRYTDTPNGYRDTTVWVWELDGVPLALAKVEDRDSTDVWQYCVASLAADSASIYLDDQIVWSKKADYDKRFYENWYFHSQPKSNAQAGPLD